MISPLLSNIYLTEVDKMLERAKVVTREGRYSHITYVRWADDLVILVDGYRKWDWLYKGVQSRLREELNKLGVEINEESSDSDTNAFSKSNREYRYRINLLFVGNVKEELFKIISDRECRSQINGIRDCIISLFQTGYID